MALYSNSMTIVGSGGSALWAVQASANNNAAVMEIIITTLSLNNSTIHGLGRSANIPVILNGQRFVAEDESRKLSLAKSGNQFTIIPTVPVQFFRRVPMAGAIGVGMAWTFPRGIVLQAGGSALCLWGINTNFNNPVELACVIEE